MALKFNIKRGDTSPALRMALAPETLNLTGASVQFQMRPKRGVTSIDEAADIITATPPVVEYAWGAGDTATAGEYEAEFRVTYADASVETFPNVGFIEVTINEDVPNA